MGSAELTARTEADELILQTPVYDPAMRARSLELVITAARGQQAHIRSLSGRLH